MAMNSHKWSLLYTTSIFITLINLLSPVFCSNHEQPSGTAWGLSFEKKTRLRSMPPSCHNKCNQCHPCMAVQAPSLLSHNRFKPGRDRAIHTEEYFDSLPSTASRKFSDYKPLGWKCKCDGHVFNP